MPSFAEPMIGPATDTEATAVQNTNIEQLPLYGFFKSPISAVAMCSVYPCQCAVKEFLKVQCLVIPPDSAALSDCDAHIMQFPTPEVIRACRKFRDKRKIMWQKKRLRTSYFVTEGSLKEYTLTYKYIFLSLR